ncbi:hypothetical protein LCGC14_0651100 [marine sediment metagenome]|uniref:Uncharacterized protein n=1 Tax=marine sediment metagenome TaxID=412755 RepID=A0A0F9THY6_9ZZZZ
MIEMNREQKFKIEKKLMGLPYVNWDRYFDAENNITVFGWINREKDNYKDFVYIEFGKPDYDVSAWGTSSKEYSEAIHKIVYSNEDVKHNDCKRVEHKFNIKNCIKLINQEKQIVRLHGRF